MFVFTRRVECDPHRMVALHARFRDERNGIGVAVSRRVIRIRSSSRNRENAPGSHVFLTAGPIRQRAATADAPRGDSLRLALGVGTLTLPPQARLVQDDGRFAFRLNCSSSSGLRNTAIVMISARVC
jgi:hypothetical protein